LNSFSLQLVLCISIFKYFNMDSRSITLAGDKEVGMTATPSPRPSFEKESKTDLDDVPTDNEDGSVTNGSPGEGGEEGEEEVEGEYPEGLRLAFIVIALMLSIFLVSFHTHCLPPQS
jgi:MFS transporter, DHA2 family, glioxin efflux transporter